MKPEKEVFYVHLKDIPIASIDDVNVVAGKDLPMRLSFHKPTVLIVDDVKTNRQLFHMHLADFNIKTIESVKGQDAVDKVHNCTPDLILMDVQMPIMDGYTAAREIRKWESVSANADSDIWETEDRGQRTEVTGKRTEVGRQRTEVR